MSRTCSNVEARPGDEPTMTELDMKLQDWASAELNIVSADTLLQ